MPEVTGTYEIKSWDENPYAEEEDGGKLTRATITERVQVGELEGDAVTETLMCYTADGTASYAGFMRFVGRIGDRSGSFVEQSTGIYDGTQAKSTSVVVPGSGTGDLKGLRGEGTSESTSQDYPNRPFTLNYRFEK